ncbi:MAG TPA: phosphosulfolactate synthase [Actinomycetota bacterium]|nr:phosphosulfolactate synthase [Actinomycetota bacterium]
MASSGFLDLPPRSSKPRRAGVTHVLDKGLPVAGMEPLLAILADHVDLWKLGWGTAYLDPGAGDKVALLARHEVRACVGGTLLEVAWAQGKAEACLAWAGGLGFPCVEVSNGAVGMPLAEKRRLIAQATEGFTVLAEVGAKDPGVPVSPSRWAAEMLGDLEAGASWAVAEGRESGTVGLYRPDGSVRDDVVDAVVGAVGLRTLIFEAPARQQQAWFIRRFGPDVSLGNVPAPEVLGLEALRLGLRADTIELARSRSAAVTVAGP